MVRLSCRTKIKLKRKLCVTEIPNTKQCVVECSRSNVVSFPLGVRIYCFCCLFGELLCVSTVARGLGCKKRESHFLLDFSEEANIF